MTTIITITISTTSSNSAIPAGGEAACTSVHVADELSGHGSLAEALRVQGRRVPCNMMVLMFEWPRPLE